jgi:hypothetical protein
MIRPAAEIYLTAVVPNDCETEANDQDAVGVFFYTYVCFLLGLEVFDQFRSLAEELFLILIAGEQRIGEYLWNFHDDTARIQMRIETNLFELAERYSVCDLYRLRVSPFRLGRCALYMSFVKSRHSWLYMLVYMY